MVDPQDELKEKCGELPTCAKLREVLDTCNERVESRSNTTEDCNQELFDFVHCVDHCVSEVLPHAWLSFGVGGCSVSAVQCMEPRLTDTPEKRTPMI